MQCFDNRDLFPNKPHPDPLYTMQDILTSQLHCYNNAINPTWSKGKSQFTKCYDILVQLFAYEKNRVHHKT
jgi:hypothetical protein